MQVCCHLLEGMPENSCWTKIELFTKFSVTVNSMQDLLKNNRNKRNYPVIQNKLHAGYYYLHALILKLF